ncbi:Protein CBG04886 [Caenorhabditis briggsae]|uniref:Protein CBG04886 n=1 Tax=Caenorhabditis briggsae TaxID=6238 RepID=A8WYQ4_CAEBR|nr:Protein CBG04886 [Caenorhabditis briggsae]CAP25512.2 Protein CBG04886 [Caenorhabditis briggsae]
MKNSEKTLSSKTEEEMTSDLIVYWETSLFVRRHPLLLGSLEFAKNKTRKMKTLLEYGLSILFSYLAIHDCIMSLVVTYVTNVILLGIGVLFLYVGIRDNCWSGRLDVCFYLPTWMILVAVLIFIDRLIYWKHKFNGVIFEGKFPRPRSSIRNSNKEQIRQWQKDKQKRSSSKKLRTSSIVFRVILSLVTFGLTITALHVLIAAVHGKGAENPDPIIFSFYFGLLTLFVYFCMLIKYFYNFCMSRVKKSKSTTPAPMPNP